MAVPNAAGHSAPEIRKIDAARRQLDEAIRLWIEGRDQLAIHTIAMAAFGILYDVAEHHGILSIEHPLKQFLTRVGHRRYRELANFLKHADRDPTASYREPLVEDQEYRIGFALVMYRRITGEVTPEMDAFHHTMRMAHPEHFKIPPDPDPDIEEMAQVGAEMMRNNLESRRQCAAAVLAGIKSGSRSSR